MRLYIRLYRTHDFDLAALHYTGALNVSKAIKMAIIAFYKGESFYFETNEMKSVDLLELPIITVLTIDISEKDAPGITAWIRGLRKGYRNCCCKGIVRHYIKNACISMFRDDGWEYNPTLEKISTVTLPKRKEAKKKVILMGSEWVEAVAKEKIGVNADAKISDLDKMLNKKSENGYLQNSMSDVIVDTGSANDPADVIESDEDDFDAFAEFENLRDGKGV